MVLLNLLGDGQTELPKGAILRASEGSFRLGKWVSTGGDFAPRRYSAMSGDTCGCHTGDRGVLLASSG